MESSLSTHLEPEQLEEGIKRILEGFEDVETFITNLREGLSSDDEPLQKSCIFLSVQLIQTVYKFREQVMYLSESKRIVALPTNKKIYTPKGRQKKWK